MQNDDANEAFFKACKSNTHIINNLKKNSHDFLAPYLYNKQRTEVNHQHNSRLLNNPIEVLDIIIKKLNYEDISKLRLVCVQLNILAMPHLNRGYDKFCSILEEARGKMKKVLPKKESERRIHPLWKISDIYAALETRRTLLDMTYRKYIGENLVCFIPGKVLDEGFRLLQMLQRCMDVGGCISADTCTILRDFRDLTSMAMEHFEETIEPSLKNMTPFRGPTVIKALFTPPVVQQPANVKIIFEPSGKTEQDDLRKIIERQQNTINSLQSGLLLMVDLVEKIAHEVNVAADVNTIRSLVVHDETTEEQRRKRKMVPTSPNDEPCSSKSFRFE